MNAPRRSLLALSSLFAAVALLGIAPAHAQKSARAVYQEGVQLFQQERYTEALKRFQKVLRHKPGYVYARNYVNRCKKAIAKGQGSGTNLEEQLARLIVPEVNFEEAPIGDVLQFMSTKARELSDGEVVANFIYKGTSQQRENTTVTLSLRNVPLTEAIRYVGQLTSTQFRYDEHAVVADPNSSPSSGSGSGTAGSGDSASTGDEGGTDGNVFE